MSLADKIVVMRDGHILQVGAPMDLYNRPGDIFTARFIGSPEMNIIGATLRGGRAEFGANAAAIRWNAAEGLPSGSERKVSIGVRPQELTLTTPDDNQAAFLIEGTVRVAEPHGSETFVHLDLPEGSIVARARSEHTYRPGEKLCFAAEGKSVRIFDAATEKLLH
ncbi:oligosaccharides import ATP-binding protein MsmX [Brucella sp. NBRC 14130]|uniref:TOBE domain-containing protein n=1 Tax=Brucella sp. NBRC 14130 TaxID=3075483 RepID=UPI0030A0D7A7